MTPHAKFSRAMVAVKLRQCDLAKLVGMDRRTVWRWQVGKTPVPDYAWTIVRSQKKIRDLTVELCM